MSFKLPTEIFDPEIAPMPASGRAEPLRARRRLPALPAKLWEGDATVVLTATRKNIAPIVPAPVPTRVQTKATTAIPADVADAVPTVVAPTAATEGSSIRLWLVPRDPFSLLAHWNAAAAELARMSAHWGVGNWLVRVHLDDLGGTIAAEPIVDLLQAHLFVPVLRPGRSYVAELGFRDRKGRWRPVAVSEPTQTPPDAAVGAVARPVIGHFQPRRRPADAHTATSAGTTASTAASQLTPSSTAAADRLAQFVWREFSVRESGSSGEVLERRVELHAIAGETGGRTTVGRSFSAPSNLPSSEAPAGPPVPRGFWFEVNAELIVHGRTEPDARVTLGGRPVTLRPDGSFTFRFALPDGDFALPAMAVAATGDDTRTASMRFTRDTKRKGEVGHHPLAAALRPPTPDAIG